MPSNRPPLVVAAAALVLVLGVALPGAAQTQRDVDEAEERRDAAIDDLEEAARERALLEGALLGSLDDYERVNHELEQVGFALGDAHDAVAEQEATVRALRAEVRALVARAYMAGGPNALALAAGVSPGHESVIARAVAERTSDRNRDRVRALAAARAELDDLRGDLRRQQARVARLEAAAAELVAELDRLLAGSTDDVESATAAVAAADAAYRDALTRYGEEQRRLAALGGVARWVGLVEQYFPEHLVNQALRIMHCESRGNPDATNPISDAAGLFQFLPGTWAFASSQVGLAGASRYDPEANVAAAAWLVDFSISSGHPWGAWGRWACRGAASGPGV